MAAKKKRKKARSAAQKAATKRMLAANKRIRGGKRSPGRKVHAKLSQKRIHEIAVRENAVPLSVLKRRAIVSAETLVKRMRQAGVTDIAEIPDYKPKGRRSRRK